MSSQNTFSVLVFEWTDMHCNIGFILVSYILTSEWYIRPICLQYCGAARDNLFLDSKDIYNTLIRCLFDFLRPMHARKCYTLQFINLKTVRYQYDFV